MINPFSDLGKETQNPFLDTRIRIWIFPKKRTLRHVFNLRINCIYDKMFDGDWFSVHLFDMLLEDDHVGFQFELFIIG